jgi:hypothetical protein
MIKFNQTSAQEESVNVSSQTDQPAPLHIIQPHGVYDLSEALGSAEAALVVCKLRAWLTYNQAQNPHISYRDGRWWTFSSLEKWCRRDFKWLTPRQLGTIMKRLETMKVIIRRQYGADDLKMAYWYSVNEHVLATLLDQTESADAFDKNVESSDENVKWFDKNVEYKTTEKENKNQNKPSKTQTTASRTPARDDTETDAVPGSPAVVVVTPPRPITHEAETGEMLIDAEEMQSLKDEMRNDASDVEAQQSQHPNDTSLSKVPQKVLSPQAADVLRADLIRFGVVPHQAARLVRTYPEADIRYVLAHARAATNLHNPPGFLVGEMDQGGAGVLALRDQQKITFNQTSLISPALTEDRLAEMRRETARMMGEDPESLIECNHQPANHPDVGTSDASGQTVISKQHLEYAL